mgnify:CR=1 FL=1
MSYKSILCISDLHIPYHHPQAFDFLKALKKKINPDLIVCGGDELDKHALFAIGRWRIKNKQTIYMGT